MRGHVDIISRNKIAGWAADPENPTRQVPIRITVNGRLVRIHANQPRDALKDSFPGATGDYGFSLVDQLVPMSPFVDNEVKVAYAGTETLLPGGSALLPALGEQRSRRLIPVVVTSTGRAGTSLLMGRLGRHPRVLVAREHPHELMLLGYYSAAFRTLTSEGDRQRSTNHENMLALHKRFFIGSNPYHDATDARDAEFKKFWEARAPEHLRNSFSSIISDYYDILAKKQEKPNARYFVEKISSSDLVREGTAYFFGDIYEILMLRDPRDVVCSSKSFWKRDFTTSIGVIRSELMNMARPRAQVGLRQLVLRYEDLVLSPEETMTRVFDFLNLAQTYVERDSEKEARIFNFHGTSPSQVETIGRWKREMTEEEVSLANRELGPMMERFGYSVG